MFEPVTRARNESRGMATDSAAWPLSNVFIATCNTVSVTRFVRKKAEATTAETTVVEAILIMRTQPFDRERDATAKSAPMTSPRNVKMTTELSGVTR